MLKLFLRDRSYADTALGIAQNAMASRRIVSLRRNPNSSGRMRALARTKIWAEIFRCIGSPPGFVWTHARHDFHETCLARRVRVRQHVEADCSPSGARLPPTVPRWQTPHRPGIAYRRLDWPPKRLWARKPVSGRGASLSSGQEVSAVCSSGGDPEQQLSTNRPRPDRRDPTFLEGSVYTLSV